ncbi:MAG: phosphoribosyl-ATP diphosphatase [Nitrospirota bacterium]
MILDDIYDVILDRKKSACRGSYVSALIAKGKDEILKKIGEESIEVIIASKAQDKAQLINEIADLWFHCLVLMAEEKVTHADVLRELEDRFNRKRR